MKYDLIAEAYLNSMIYLSEDMLMEDRIDVLKQMYPTIDTSHDLNATHRSPSDIIDHFANNADPTNNKVYTQYLLNLYKKKTIKQEDAPRIKETLTNFDRYKQFLSPDKKQLNPKTYPSIDDIHREVLPHIGRATTNKEAREQLRNNPLNIEGHRQVYKDQNITAYDVSDEETSQKMYGSATAKRPGALPTEWCTAWMEPRVCQLKRYKEVHGGNVYAIHHKDGSVYQYHTNTGQFMNRDNEWLNEEEWNKLKPSMHKMWNENPEMLDSPEKNKPNHLVFLAKYGKAEHIDSALDRVKNITGDDEIDIPEIYKAALNNKDSNESNWNKIIKQPKFDAGILANRRIRNEDLLTTMSMSENSNIRKNAALNKNATTEHINRAASDENESVREAAIKANGHKLDAQKINHMMMNDSDKVIHAGLSNPASSLISDDVIKHLANNHPDKKIKDLATQIMVSRHFEKAYRARDEE